MLPAGLYCLSRAKHLRSHSPLNPSEVKEVLRPVAPLGFHSQSGILDRPITAELVLSGDLRNRPMRRQPQTVIQVAVLPPPIAKVYPGIPRVFHGTSGTGIYTLNTNFPLPWSGPVQKTPGAASGDGAEIGLSLNLGYGRNSLEIWIPWPRGRKSEIWFFGFGWFGYGTSSQV